MGDTDKIICKNYQGSSRQGTNDQIMPRMREEGECSQIPFPII